MPSTPAKRRKSTHEVVHSLHGTAVCDACRIGLSASIHIRCAECDDVALCLHCFAEGSELKVGEKDTQKKEHDKTHKYRVIDHITTPIFDIDWGADEELMLLEGIEMYGMGNWDDVAEHVSTKNKMQCEMHYHAVYLNSSTAPVPDTKASLISPAQYPKDAFDYDYFAAMNDPLPKPSGRQIPLLDYVTYRPKRQDFDIEYNNAAEERIADVDLSFHDEPEDLKLKLKLIQIYNRKLDERDERREFLVKRDLLHDKEARRVIGHPGTSATTRLGERLKPLLRFSENEEHQKFIQSIQKEDITKFNVERLRFYRKMGIRCGSEEAAFLNEAKKRIDAVDKKIGFDVVPKRGIPIKTKGDRTIRSILNVDGNPIVPQLPKSKSFDIAAFESVDLLNSREASLCIRHTILPVHLLQLKYLMVKESFQKGYLSRSAAMCLVSVEEPVLAAIYDYLVEAKLINSTPPSSDADLASLMQGNGLGGNLPL